MRKFRSQGCNTLTVFSFSFLTLMASAAIAAPSSSGAADSAVLKKSLPKIHAMQNRPQDLAREYSLGFTFLPSDHFTQYYGLTAAYSLYFEDHLGWEVVNFSFFKEKSTGLKEELISTYGALPGETDIIEYQITTNVFYTPLFMKHLVRNKNVMWGDLTLAAGGGVANLTREGFQTMIDFGGAIRFFKDEHWIYKLDIRQLIYMSNAVDPNISITFGVSYTYSKEDK